MDSLNIARDPGEEGEPRQLPDTSNHNLEATAPIPWDFGKLQNSHTAAFQLPGDFETGPIALPRCKNRINIDGGHTIPKPTDTDENDTCPVCWVLSSITLSRPWDTTTKNHPLTLRSLPLRTSLDSMIVNDSLFLGNIEKVILGRRMYGSEVGRGTYSFQNYPYLPVGGCMVELSPWTHEKHPTLPYLQNPGSDIDSLKCWIDECCEKHDGICSGEDRDGVIGMRVINADSREIIPASTGTVYAALSYVWGTTNHEQREQLHHLPSPSPRTIEDALELCRRLNISYLWVDQYCISQVDSKEKHFQISQMHKIYKRARVTIIAAAGKDANYGLPGVSSTPLQAQPHLWINERLFAAVLPHPINTIEKSTWYTRGWTYQEALLSTRRLIFTDQQTYFECNHHTYAEGIREPIRSLAGLGSLSPRTYNSSLTLRREKRSPSDIWYHIYNVSQRKFTYEADVIDAVSGVIGDFVETGHLYGHICGIPLYRNLPKIFDTQEMFSEFTGSFLTELLWQVESPTTRREHFPSWSWAGWCGVGYRPSRQAHLTHKMNQTRSVFFGTKDGTSFAEATGFPYGFSDATDDDLMRNVWFVSFFTFVIRCRFTTSLLPYVYIGGQLQYIGEELRMTLDLSMNPRMADRLRNQWWDGLIFDQDGGDSVVMVVQGCRGHYQRLGLFVLDKSNAVSYVDGQYNSLHLWAKIQKVRLG